MARGVYRGPKRAPGPPERIPAPPPSSKRRSGWWTVAVIAGVAGAGYFFVWPRIRSRQKQLTAPPVGQLGPPPAEPGVPRAELSVPPPASVVPVPPAASAEPPRPSPYPSTNASELEQAARSNGFSSVAAYENSVLLNARQLRNSGAAVTLAPHLAHLAPQLYG